MANIVGTQSARLKISLFSLSWTHTGKNSRMKLSALFQPVLLPAEKENCMPKLSNETRKELQKLAARPDREIDLTDIPEIREIPSDAVIGKFYRPKKTSVTIRLDSDVVAWIKASGEGYQTRINAYLRQLMQLSR
jgi:uncharacterized protein (DUF4415 family)